MKIADYLLHTLKINGLDTIFGNPGTTEIPLVRACEQLAGMEYIVALSEIAAVPMADGYARALRKPGVVNLHVAPGLGNGMGALYTAGVAGTPLLVLVGGQDRRFLHTDPILWGPVDRMAQTVCKAVYALNTRHDAAPNVHRALHAVMTPPYKPVALICPPDLLNETIEATPGRLRAPSLPGLSASDARRYAVWLTKARSLALIVTEEVYWSDAGAEVEALAAMLGASIYAAPYTGVLAVSSRAHGYSGYLPPSFVQIAQRLEAHDAMLVLGGRGFRTTLYSDARIAARKAWIGHGPQIPVFDSALDLAAIADTRLALAAIRSALPRQSSRKAAVKRAALRAPASETLHPTRAMAMLLSRYGRSVWIDESGLSTSDARAMMRLPAGDYFINGSGGIGWGVPAAVGAALARRDRQVVAVIGDGSTLYASEALWTAAHHRTTMLLVVFSNGRYATLNEAASRLAGRTLRSFTIEPPAIDFSGLAKLYGWRYLAASSEDELTRGLARAGAPLERNTILELKLDPALKPVTASRHF
ncbi:MAG: thiamine pyrophosphate-binding protein [Rhodospirillaceae bacterium]